MRGVASSAACRDGKQANELLVMRIKQGSGNKHKARAATRLRAVDTANIDWLIALGTKKNLC